MDLFLVFHGPPELNAESDMYVNISSIKIGTLIISLVSHYIMVQCWKLT